MKSLTFIRGVGLAGALTITHAAVAFGATAQAVTSHATSAKAHGQSAAALAQSTGENTPLHLSGSTVATHAASTSGGGASIVRTIVGLFIVIAVIYGIAWVMKQAKKSKTRPTGTSLTQVASLPLGSGRSVAVVRAGREVLVVGVAENGVTPIRSYSEAEAIALGIEVPAEGPTGSDQAEKPSDRVLNVLRRMTARS
jgi:flagellar biosynthetic protein FliO